MTTTTYVVNVDHEYATTSYPLWTARLYDGAGVLLSAGASAAGPIDAISNATIYAANTEYAERSKATRLAHP